MALVFTEQADNLNAVYSDLVFEIFDSVRQHEPDLRYVFELLVNGTDLRTFTYLPNPENKARVNFSKELSNFFNSEIHINTLIPETIPGGIVSYVLTGKSISGVVTESDVLAEAYVFNGVEDIYNLFVKADYMAAVAAGAKFLNKWNGRRRVHLTDKSSVQFLQGDFGSGNVSDVPSFDIKVTSKTGGEVTTNYNVSLSSTPQVVSLDTSPVALNTIIGVVIDENTFKYEIAGIGSSTETLVFEVYDVDSRFDEYFRIAYVDLHGATDYINFDRVNTNELKTKRNTYFNNNKRRGYRTSALDRITALTEYLTQQDSINLKELWTAPVLGDVTSGVVKDIILESKKIPIDKRRNKKLISYLIEFHFAHEYRIQTN